MVKDSVNHTTSWINGTHKGKADAGLIGELNRSIVLNFIRQEGSISRAEIALRTQLSRSAVSNIISSLLDEGIVQESGIGESKGGRRPIMVNFNYSVAYVLGIDMGANHILALLADLEGNPVAEFNAEFSVENGPEIGIPILVELIRQILESEFLKNKRLYGIGLGVTGPLDFETGTVVMPPLMPGWNKFPLRRYLSEEFQLPVLVDNDANLGAIGERWRGAGLGQNNLAYVKIGTGIGCGMVVDGKIFRGANGSAGEIGHITITRDGPPCRCGSFGCLESMAGAPAIINRIKLAIQAGRDTILTKIGEPDDLTVAVIGEAAASGDRLSVEVISDAGRYIGIALATLVNLFNPSMIILGGGVAAVGEVILNQIKQTAKDRSLVASFQGMQIVPGKLGREAVAVGAAMLVLQEVFKGPQLSLVTG
ncbi:MAG: ROK family transcriptional regulator [Chloroflexi bacterium]|uniref:ROK family transcriptional regulator n=1 Tax=Candidatus Chlorohelix allophototropha TaxID=3003348 RepID=A0A8T7M5I5_9CHLR|nr:ROK family transcriptional regulator [Chloroflexota bacterium]WJW69269.1 ROK family transcriptional regulator [Chloroflexota bacterium L227-S17]